MTPQIRSFLEGQTKLKIKSFSETAEKKCILDIVH